MKDIVLSKMTHKTVSEKKFQTVLPEILRKQVILVFLAGKNVCISMEK